MGVRAASTGWSSPGLALFALLLAGTGCASPAEPGGAQPAQKAEQPQPASTGTVPAAGAAFLARLKALDKDGDGRVSEKELGRPALMESLDLDEDGFIDESEMKTAAARMRLQQEARDVEVDSSPDKGRVQADPKLIEEYYFPPLAGNDWEKVSPATLGWDEKKLAEAVEFVGGRNSHALLILYKGRIVVEKYYGDWTMHSRDTMASAAKSITSTLAGIAAESGRLSIEDPVSKYMGVGWSKAPPEKEKLILLRHCLTMSTGLDQKLGYVTDAGGAWEYNNRTYHMGLDALEKAVGKGRNAYTDEVLWSKIGAHESRWGWASVLTTARDQGRYGLLVLNKGKWADTRVVSGEWLAKATDTSQPLNESYGFLWWLAGKKTFRAPGPRPEAQNGPMIPDAPADCFAALGKYDRKVFVVPSRHLVVVRQGKSAGRPRDAASTFSNQIWQKLMPALPKAVAPAGD